MCPSAPQIGKKKAKTYTNSNELQKEHSSDSNDVRMDCV
jgi:hypothetical protein